MALIDKHEKFCNEYLVDLNLTQAYLRVYPKSKPEAARRSASDLLTNPDIQARIAELMRAREQRTQVTQDRVVQRLANIAFGDLGMICTWTDMGLVLKDSKDLTVEERAIIDSVNIKPVSDGDGGILGVDKKVNLKDSVKALELLGKHLGMFDGNGANKNDRTNAKERLSGAVARVRERLAKRGAKS